jgi:hypothetical protein
MTADRMYCVVILSNLRHQFECLHFITDRGSLTTSLELKPTVCTQFDEIFNVIMS